MNKNFRLGFTKSASALLIERSNAAGSYGDEWSSTKEKRGERQALLEALIRGKKAESKSDMVESDGFSRTPESWVGNRLG